MPRKSKRTTQAPRAENDQSYGEKGAALDAQRAMPLPDIAGQRQAAIAQAPGAAPAAAPGPGSSAAPGPALDPMDAAVAAGAGYVPSNTPLDAPSRRPMEPVTAGAPLGAGPGLEALGVGGPAPTSPTVQALQVLARTSNDARIADLADQAAAFGS